MTTSTMDKGFHKRNPETSTKEETQMGHDHSLLDIEVVSTFNVSDLDEFFPGENGFEPSHFNKGDHETVINSPSDVLANHIIDILLSGDQTNLSICLGVEI